MSYSQKNYNAFMGSMIRKSMAGDLMRFGDGWYLFRCQKCGQAFLATSMAMWCDCGNTEFKQEGGPRDNSIMNWR